MVNRQRLVGPFIVLAIWTGPLAGQAVIRIGDTPTCSTCKAELVPVVQLGSLDDPAGFAPVIQLAKNSEGLYVVSSTTFDGELFVYGTDGRFVRAVGRRGEGPGEFRRPQLLAFDALDSLHAIEAGGPRHSVFAPDLSFVRTVEMQTRTIAMRIEDSGNVFAVAPRQSGEESFALQVLLPNGSFLHAFDPIDPNASGQAALGRNIAVDAHGQRWSVGMAEYHLKQWDQEGRLERVLEARRNWIPESIPMRLERDQRPPAQIAGLEVDDDGFLWIFAAVPDANWTPPSPGTRPSPESMYDTLVEVIDPTAGTLMTRSTFDQLVLPFGRGSAYSMLEEASGDLRAQVWKLQLSGR